MYTKVDTNLISCLSLFLKSSLSRMGSTKAAVFPEPVTALAQISCPFNNGGIHRAYVIINKKDLKTINT